MWWLDSKLRRFAWWRKWRGLPEPMLNPVLQAIAREALRIAHERASFISLIDLDYPVGASGDKLKIRKPVTYTRRVKDGDA